MYVCMYLRVYVNMYVYIYIYIYTLHIYARHAQNEHMYLQAHKHICSNGPHKNAHG
jgi:hypothetical protein